MDQRHQGTMVHLYLFIIASIRKYVIDYLSKQGWIDFINIAELLLRIYVT